MLFLKKYYLEITTAIGIVALFFVTRLYNILSLPIFTDEAIYIRWSQIAKQDASWRFISLTDGKQPLFVWINMLTLKFVHDPLLAGRLVSVMSGFGAAVGLYFLGREIFKNRYIGLIASFLYVIYPFSLVYDRMALYDSLVATFTIWSLLFEVLLIRRKRLDLALILGVIMGGGMLTKTNAFFSIYSLPFSLLLFNFKKDKFNSLLKWAGLALVSTAFAYSYYSILRLSPFFHIITEKDHLFVYPFSVWIKHPFQYFWGNFNGLSGWLIGYSTIPFLILILLSFAINRKFLQEKLLLLVWFGFPFIADAFFGKVIYPRHVLFTSMPLIALAAFSIYSIMERFKSNVYKFVIFLVFIAFMLRSDFYVITDFARAPIPDADTSQYINGWTAGGGIKEAVNFFENQAKDKQIYIGTEGTFGLMPYSLEIYLVNNPNIKIKGYWPMQENTPQDVVEISKKMPTYFVFYQPCVNCAGPADAPKAWNIKLIGHYNKGTGSSYLNIYQVNPQ